jgi:hypothetical protein
MAVNSEISDIENATTRIIIASAKFMEIAKSEPDWVKVLVTSTDTIPEI